MAIFDRFVSRETGEQERKSFHSTPYRKIAADLDAAGKEARAQYPADARTVDQFVSALKESCKLRYASNKNPQPMKAEARFFLSDDRMRAYACLLPPENGGEELSLGAFLADMRYEGVRHGVLQEEIQREFSRGPFHIFLAAQGTLPQAGDAGEVSELFQRHRNMCLEVQNGCDVDFRQGVQLQPIRHGTVICTIRPPTAGVDGTDVTGQTLPCPQTADVPIPQGINTAISRDGQSLVAGVDGILYIENDKFCIHEQKIIDGDLDQFQGTLRITGNLYVGGNVEGGVAVEATGEIVIRGKMGQAHVVSTGGTIRVQQGIYGTSGKTFVSAASQVQSPVIEQAEIHAGTSVIAETVSNSSIRCGGTVYVTNGRGMIVDSTIQAGESILCLRTGNLAGGRSRFSIGYPPHVPESWEKIKNELAEVQSTLELLWDSITSLRRKGVRMSDAEKVILDRLVEQRTLYTEKRETLTADLRTVNKALDKKSSGRIQCEKLFPFLDVQIGRVTEEITTTEENCNIRLVDSRILLH